VKVFISWSGTQSLQVAEALRDWLPQVLQAVEPFLSVEDTVKGTYWGNQVKQELESARFGIVCLTPDNLTAPWLNFEAGALSNSFEKGNVVPFLFGVAEGDLTGPLVQFQATQAGKRDDVLRLVKHLDAACDRAVGERRVDISFSMWWPLLERALEAVSAPPVIRQRPVDDMVVEILNSMRTLLRHVSDSPGALSFQYMDALVRQATNVADQELQTELADALRELTETLDACADSDNPVIRQIAARAEAVRVVYEKLTGSRGMYEPLRKRVIRGIVT
jgi:TIR domain